MENKIYKEAILDAKALRASAIANAKSMMQEAIEPAIQEMMRLKLSEELEEDTLEEELEETYEEGYEDKDHANMEETYDEGDEHAKMEEEVTEATLEEILAELEALEEDETLNEAEEEEEEETGEEEEAVAGDAENVSDSKEISITFGELKKALFPYAETDEEDEEEAKEEAPVSLDEILAELEEKEHDMKKEEGMKHKEDKDDVNEILQSQGASKALGDIVGPILGVNPNEVPAEVLGNIVGGIGGFGIILATALLTGNWGKVKEFLAGKKAQLKAAYDVYVKNKGMGEAEKVHSMEEELEMAKETIQTLRESINEINLLNAKLLYMNKIFKAKNLTESEKVKVVKAFDRNTNVKEVKNTYETLKESFQAKKTQIKESVGFASKPIGSVAKNDIIEADPFLNRWKKIAGIK